MLWYFCACQSISNSKEGGVREWLSAQRVCLISACAHTLSHTCTLALGLRTLYSSKASSQDLIRAESSQTSACAISFLGPSISWVSSTVVADVVGGQTDGRTDGLLLGCRLKFRRRLSFFRQLPLRFHGSSSSSQHRPGPNNSITYTSFVDCSVSQSASPSFGSWYRQLWVALWVLLGIAVCIGLRFAVDALAPLHSGHAVAMWLFG